LALKASRRLLSQDIVRAGALIAETFAKGNKVLLCGNGGSAADGQHFAAELTGRYRKRGRRALPALALTADSAFLTAWSNDVGFDDVFARQVEAYGQPGDLLIGISTSGRSANVLKAFERARELGLQCLAIGGGSGGDMLGQAYMSLLVPAADTQNIQEVHLVIFHLLCDEIEWHIAANAQRQTVKQLPAKRRPAKEQPRRSSLAVA
jgi:D-inositol-3-phosphate glycosyltransferase